jgi:hypothetical protein
VDVIEHSEEPTSAERESLRWAEALSKVSASALRALGHQDSRRGKQRAVALLLGHSNGGRIRAYSLRWSLSEQGIFNSANFAQDMTKDSNEPAPRGRGAEGLWSCHTYRSGRGLGGEWRLTERGSALAAEYVRLVDSAVERRIEVRKEVKETVKRTFVIRAKAARCAYCLETVTAEDRAVCQCGSEVHALCLDEFGSDGRCALRQTTARCGGRYKVIAKPAVEVAEVLAPPCPFCARTGRIDADDARIVHCDRCETVFSPAVAGEGV